MDVAVAVHFEGASLRARQRTPLLSARAYNPLHLPDSPVLLARSDKLSILGRI